MTSSYEAIAAPKGRAGDKAWGGDRIRPTRGIPDGRKSAVLGTTAPFGFRNRGRLGRPRATARHDETHIARGRAHQGRITTRTSRQIEDHEVGPPSDPNRAGAVPIGETTSPKGHFENSSGSRTTVHPGDTVREFDLSQHGGNVDHRVVRSEQELNPGLDHVWDVRRHAEEGVRSRAQDDRDGRIGTSYQVGIRRVKHVDKEHRGEVEDLVDVLSDALGAVDGEHLLLPTDMRSEFL